MARKLKARKGKGLLAWRSRQKPGAIMKPKTFGKIAKSVVKAVGAKRAAKIAGAAYWATTRAKYKKYQKRTKKR